LCLDEERKEKGLFLAGVGEVGLLLLVVLGLVDALFLVGEERRAGRSEKAS
jgi:hypothetical protein